MNASQVRHTLCSAAYYGPAIVARRYRDLDEQEQVYALEWLMTYAPGTWQSKALAAINAAE